MGLFSNLILNTREPVYFQIVRQVKIGIVLGKLCDGDPLPSRRELAMQLNINPNTVQKAYRQLEELGLTRTEGNLRSTAVVTPDIRDALCKELHNGVVDAFIEQAREVGLSFQDAIALISGRWVEHP